MGWSVRVIARGEEEMPDDSPRRTDVVLGHQPEDVLDDLALTQVGAIVMGFPMMNSAPRHFEVDGDDELRSQSRHTHQRTGHTE